MDFYVLLTLVARMLAIVRLNCRDPSNFFILSGSSVERSSIEIYLFKFIAE